MNKTDLIKAVAAEVSETTGREVKVTVAASIINSALAKISNAVDVGEKVQLRGFGSFQAQNKAERRGRNPQTGEPLVIAAKTVMKFKPARAGEEDAA